MEPYFGLMGSPVPSLPSEFLVMRGKEAAAASRRTKIMLTQVLLGINILFPPFLDIYALSDRPQPFQSYPLERVLV